MAAHASIPIAVDSLEPFDTTTEQPIPLKEACKLIPSHRTQGGCVSEETLRRWAIRGVKRQRGGSNTVRLQAVYIGRPIYTSRESVQRFIERLSGVSATTADQNAQ